VAEGAPSPRGWAGPLELRQPTQREVCLHRSSITAPAVCPFAVGTCVFTTRTGSRKCRVECGRSSVFGCDALQLRHERRVGCGIHGTMPDGGAGRIVRQVIACSAVLCRADRPRYESAATVRADVVQHLCDASRTECAFEGAYPGLGRGWREHGIAVFATWTQFKHGTPNFSVRISAPMQRSLAAFGLPGRVLHARTI